MKKKLYNRVVSYFVASWDELRVFLPLWEIERRWEETMKREKRDIVKESCNLVILL